MEKTLKFSVNSTELEVTDQFLTGLKIKELAGVPESDDLYLVVPGYADELITNEKDVNLARPGVERFVSRAQGSGITIFVNSKPQSHSKPATTISYEQVVKYAFPDAKFNPNVGYTVTYHNGPSQNEEGILVMGAKVVTKHHMCFDVTPTHRS
ncbi:MAG: multiubiquitin domain-containing protein [Duncaniella sp.]|nr:multiubiquitin domain-containing protein [Duncaniella sp.]